MRLVKKLARLMGRKGDQLTSASYWWYPLGESVRTSLSSAKRNSWSQTRPGIVRVENSYTEKDFEALICRRLTMHCTLSLWQERPAAYWASVGLCR